MTAQILNTVGLVLGMIGVLIIFVYDPPQPNMEPGVGICLEDGNTLEDGRTVAKHNWDAVTARARHASWSKIGLGLVFFGFAAQLCAVWI